MASAATNNPARARLLHVGFMVPLKEIISDNEALERVLGHLNLRTNAYAAVLFYKDAHQDTLHGWYDQRKRSNRNGYLRAFYANKKGDSIVEMDVDGKQFYLVTSSSTSKPPNEMKKDIGRGLYGERKEFAERIPVPCFPYKCDASVGFTECETFAAFKDELQQKHEALQSVQQNKTVS